MSQPNPRAIGLFVAGGLALVVAGLVAFGSRSYFEHRPRAVTFFHGSVAGLVNGAPVTFRGVRVGTVADVALEINSTTGEANIPVIMEFDPEHVSVAGGAKTAGIAGFAEKMLANGLSASMVMQSLITGQMAVELDYRPSAEMRLTGIDLGLPEIPEARGGLNAMKDTISRLPLQELSDNLLATLRSVNELTSAPELREILKSVNDTAKGAAATAAETRETAAAAHRMAEHADTLVMTLQPQVNAALAALNHLVTTADQRTGQIADDLHVTLGAADRTLAESQAALGEIRTLMAPRSSAVQDIESLLRSLAAAAASLRSFAEQVDRNPNALVMGRSPR